MHPYSFSPLDNIKTVFIKCIISVHVSYVEVSVSLISLYVQCVSIKKHLLVPDTTIDVYNTHKTLDFGHWEKRQH